MVYHTEDFGNALELAGHSRAILKEERTMSKTNGMAITLAAAVLLTAFGCAHLSGPSDSELITDMLAKWTEASKAEDIDAAMSFISEDFKHKGYEYEAEDKEAMRGFMEGSVDAGNYDDLEISYDPARITIDGDTAQVPDIQWVCAPGTAVIDLTLKKENGAWRIVDASVAEI